LQYNVSIQNYFEVILIELSINIIVIYRWAWSQVDKSGKGVASKKDIYWMRKKYAEIIRGNSNIENLIRKHDTHKKNALNPLEMRSLLSVRHCTSGVQRHDDGTIAIARAEAGWWGEKGRMRAEWQGQRGLVVCRPEIVMWR
jgi:hypothetical protein